jgi:hypothetical protein
MGSIEHAFDRWQTPPDRLALAFRHDPRNVLRVFTPCGPEKKAVWKRHRFSVRRILCKLTHGWTNDQKAVVG